MKNRKVITLPLLPIKNSVLLPNLMLPLSVGRPLSVAAVRAAIDSEDKTLVVVSQKDPKVNELTMEDLFPIGVRAVIRKMNRTDDTLQIIVQGHERVDLLRLTKVTPYLAAEVQPIPEPTDEGAEIEALQQAILETTQKILRLIQPEAQASIIQFLTEIKDPLYQVYLVASMLAINQEKEQALLAAKTRREALELMHDYIAHEGQVAELRYKILNQAKSEMTREQREYHLRQQLRAIQEELGESSPEQADVTELRNQIKEVSLPDEVRKEVERELKRLERLPAVAPDYQLIRTYIEFVIELPWTAKTDDILDLKRARRILDEDHHGLQEVKQRIIEHLAVLKLNPNAKAPILCFIGPPGVGKTSLGQSIARSLGRKFERTSLGGLHDEAELRGHRRTYIGAMPGRIIQAIRRAGVRNPLIMLDEVDKLGQDFRGDPAAALMEILDPAQNFEFRDNYLNLPFDLSHVFFITTANTLDTIPQPLLDRTEVIRLAGYSEEEKRVIARKYLIPRRRKEAGVKPKQLEIEDKALSQIIRRYTHEAGVRELERTLDAVFRKVATRYAEGNHKRVRVRSKDLLDMLGPEKFFEEDVREALTPGVAAGLAWTQAGGEVLYVEAVSLSDTKDLTLTGHLGDVMKESAKAARSFINFHAKQLNVPNENLSGGVHIHVPAGATPKDGPSAGVTMVTALVSLYTGLSVQSKLAMTGEITLSGLVLPVGGIKEKVLAAHRVGMKRIILPRKNESDLRDLPEHIRKHIDFLFVDKIVDVLKAAIPKLPAVLAA